MDEFNTVIDLQEISGGNCDQNILQCLSYSAGSAGYIELAPMKTIALLSAFLMCCSAQAEIALKDPASTCVALDDVGLKTRGWKDRGSSDYGCTSPYKDIGPGHPLPNNLAFYAEGQISSVKLLKLVLNVNKPEHAKTSHQALLHTAEILSKKATGQPLSQTLKKALLSGKPIKEKLGNSNITVVRDNWPTGLGYEIKIVFE